jgi:hypothetical protein
MPEHETVVPEGFALFEDGPCLQLVRRLPALKPLVESPARRALAAVAITWFPLLVLSIHGGRALHRRRPTQYQSRRWSARTHKPVRADSLLPAR